MNISIVSMTGNLIFEEKNRLLSANTPLQLSTEGWAEGMYIVILQNGDNRMTKRFVISRE